MRAYDIQGVNLAIPGPAQIHGANWNFAELVPRVDPCRQNGEFPGDSIRWQGIQRRDPDGAAFGAAPPKRIQENRQPGPERHQSQKGAKSDGKSSLEKSTPMQWRGRMTGGIIHIAYA
jgi:hypothetical protein